MIRPRDVDARTLLDLAEQCERSDGPSFVLETYIARAMRFDFQEECGGAISLPPPNYTANFDTALTLLPAPDWEYSLEWQAGSGVREMVAIVKVGDPLLWIEAEAVTPALAMCAAALIARTKA